MGFVRRRARRRTLLVAGGAAYAAGRAGAQDTGEAPPEDAPAEEPAAQTSGDAEIEELKQLAELHASGALTDDEFAAEKAKILGE